MHRLTLLGATCLLLMAPPAWADFERQPSAPTPKPNVLKLDVAERSVHAFLKTVPNLPADVLVVPATGIIPWPGVKVSEGVRAEVWSAVAGNDPYAKPFMMFAVRPDTGEVFVMYLRKLDPKASTAPKP
jgi:hypothetical protein